MSTPRTVGAVLAWVVAVGAATAVAMVAIGAIGSGIVDRGPRPLSQAEVARQLASAEAEAQAQAQAGTGSPSSTAQPTPTSQATPPATPATEKTEVPAAPQARALPSAGGTVVARCIPGVDIVSTAPAQGYRLESIEPDDGATRVRFRGSGHGKGDGRVEVYVRCQAGQPTAS